MLSLNHSPPDASLLSLWRIRISAPSATTRGPFIIVHMPIVDRVDHETDLSYH